jgi:20S proteasome alpha/beta subunit
MTLQVALVGTDGTVLASDKQIGVRNVNPFRSFKTNTKLFLDRERGRLTCWAGDDPAAKVAENIVKLENDDPHSLQKEMERIFREQTLGGLMAEGEVMLLTTRESKKIHYVQCRAGAFSSHISVDKMTTGNNTNPATSFLELFYNENFSNLSIKELVPLAAHAIVIAGRFNPAGIGGLEIVICTSQGFQIVRDEEIAELVKWSKNLDGEIGRKLFRQE